MVRERDRKIQRRGVKGINRGSKAENPTDSSVKHGEQNDDNRMLTTVDRFTTDSDGFFG